MLILSRRKNEEILIGDSGDIRIKVVSLSKRSVQLGIEAPRETPVDRKEKFGHRKDPEQKEN